MIRRAVLLLVAVVLAGAAVFVGVRAAAHPLEAGPNEIVNAEKPIDAHNSPTLAVNPRRPENVALTYRVDRPAFSAVLEWSTDGGDTWTPTALPLPAGVDRPFAPDVAFGPDGTLYVTYVNLVGDGNVPDNLWLAKSADGGRSLSPPVRVAGRFTFGARLAVGPDGTIYATWLQAEEVGFLRLAGNPAPIVASRSTDGGQTFSAPVPVSDASRIRVGTASPVIDSRGDLVILYQDFKEDRRDFEFLEGPAWDEPFALVLTRSTDRGQTFSAGTEVDAGLLPDKRILIFLAEFPSIAAGPDDRLYVSWADARNGDEDVFLRTSTDGGGTWSEPARVNDNPVEDGTAQYLPRVAVAPSGRVDVLYLDRGGDAEDVMTETALARSTDGGRTFSHVTVSSEAFDSTVGPFVEARLPIDFGSRIALVSSDDESLAAWTDSRYGDEGTGRQDIIAAHVAERSSGALAWVLAGTLGLLAILAAIGALESGRRGPERPIRAGGAGPRPAEGKEQGGGPGTTESTTESAGPHATIT